MKKTREQLEAELERPAGGEPDAGQTPAAQPAPMEAAPPPAENQQQDELALAAVLEGLLFAAAKPLSLAELGEALREFPPQPDKKTLREELQKLGDSLEKDGRGIRLCEVAGGYQLRTRPELARYLRKLEHTRPPRMSRATLETLAIVAYRQPVTRGEIEDIRGVDCGAVLRGLLEKKMVRILGRKDEPGRPLIYGTTKEFLSFFSLKDLASLPTLRDFAELSDEARQQLGLGRPKAEPAEAKQQLPQPLEDSLQLGLAPPGDDEIVQELSQALDEIRKRDARLREVLPSAPAPEKSEETGSQEPGA